MFHHPDLTAAIAADRRRDFTRAANEHRRARPAALPPDRARTELVAPVMPTLPPAICADTSRPAA